MTAAVCLKCGEFKHGAWTPCPKCRYAPDSDESYTKQLLVSDHNMSGPQLQEASETIKAGQPLVFSEEVLKKAWITKAEIERHNRGCARGCLGFLVVIAALAVLLVWWLLK